jgi:hypothetical protein
MKAWFPTDAACERVGVPSFEGYRNRQDALNRYPNTFPTEWVLVDEKGVENCTVYDPPRPLVKISYIVVHWTNGNDPSVFYILGDEMNDIWEAFAENRPMVYLNPVTNLEDINWLIDNGKPEPLRPYDVLIRTENVRNIEGYIRRGVCYDPNRNMLVKVDEDGNIVERN